MIRKNNNIIQVKIPQGQTNVKGKDLYAWQWDDGQYIEWLDVPDGTEITFSNAKASKIIDNEGNEVFSVRRIVTDGKTQIPQALLEYPFNIYAWLTVINSDSSTTKVMLDITMIKRPKPENYIDSDDEPTFREQMQAIMDGTIRVSNEALTIANDVKERADNGEFNGKDGQDGVNGKDGQDGQNGADGFSPTAKVERFDNGAEITIKDKNGETKARVYDGEGGGGHVPTDYFNNAEIRTGRIDLRRANGEVVQLDAYTDLGIKKLNEDKVDKVKNKGLSSNDFTDDYKTKLEGLENYDDTEVKADIKELDDYLGIDKRIPIDLGLIEQGSFNSLNGNATPVSPQVLRSGIFEVEVDKPLTIELGDGWRIAICQVDNLNFSNANQWVSTPTDGYIAFTSFTPSKRYIRLKMCYYVDNVRQNITPDDLGNNVLFFTEPKPIKPIEELQKTVSSQSSEIAELQEALLGVDASLTSLEGVIGVE